ncbi:MAG: hypothetical protein AAF518_17290 [Spirochaetota bacterium]
MNLVIKITTLLLFVVSVPRCSVFQRNQGEVFKSPIPSEWRTQIKIPTSGLRNYRYCEVLATFKNGNKYVTEVYTSMTFNECPEEKWSKLKEDTLRKEFNAENIMLNGPRHFVATRAKEGSGNKRYNKNSSFGGIQMMLAAQIDGNIGTELYTETIVKRWNTWMFTKGEEIYKLINDKNEEYIMQSYSKFVDKNQTIENLTQLGSKLKLPRGWKFKTEKTKKEIQVIAKGQAFVVMDNLGNVYQKIVK